MTLKEAMEKKAEKYAGKAHKGQIRKFSGEAYVSHPNNVASIVKRFKNSHKIDALVSAALLHDTIEDTETTVKDLHKLFGGLVASLVKELTSDKEEISKEGKTEYLASKMKSMSSWALVIKLADRLDNVSDLKTAPPAFAEKYVGQTRRLLKMLEAERKLTNTQNKLIKAIKDKLDELDERDIDEEWKMTVKGYHKNQTFEIFVNPTKKEVLSIDSEYVRFIIDIKRKKMYVWNSDLLHLEASKDLGIDYDNDKDYAYGTGFHKRNGLLVLSTMITDSYTKLKKEITSGNHWSSKYFAYKKKIDEAFVSGHKIENNYFEIFVNPTTKEIESLEGDVRYIIDEDAKKIYFFSANLLHYDATARLKMPYMIHDKLNYIYGAALMAEGKLKIVIVNSMSSKLIKSVKRKDHWTAKYFSRTYRSKKLTEAFATSMKGLWRQDKHKTYDIYVNPTKQEISSFEENHLRFIADDKNKKLYIFNAALLHSSAAENIKNLVEFSQQSRGIASINKKTKMLKATEMSMDHVGFMKKLKKKDYWALKYFVQGKLR